MFETCDVECQASLQWMLDTEKNGNSRPQKVTILSTTQWRPIWRAHNSIDTFTGLHRRGAGPSLSQTIRRQSSVEGSCWTVAACCDVLWQSKLVVRLNMGAMLSALLDLLLLWMVLVVSVFWTWPHLVIGSNGFYHSKSASDAGAGGSGTGSSKDLRKH